MARILMVHPGPDFSVADVHQGWEAALTKLGHTVMTYNTNDRLTFYGKAKIEVPDSDRCAECGEYKHKLLVPESDQLRQLATKGLMETCYLFWPDVIFFISAFFQSPAQLQVLKTRGHKLVLLHTESPYQDDEQMVRGEFADLNLINDPCNIEAWRDMGIPVRYQPHSYNPKRHYVDGKGLKKECDFTFVGTAFQSRCKFFHDMDLSTLGRVSIGGGGWDTCPDEYSDVLKYLGHPVDQCVDNEETARIYRISKTGINFYRRESEESHKGEGWAMGPREIEMAACGLFFLRDPRGESDEVFGGSRQLGLPDVLPTFTDAGDASEQLKWWIKHDEARNKAALRARDCVMNRTFDNAARTACTWMEEAGCL
jgi:hypothetical protein